MLCRQHRWGGHPCSTRGHRAGGLRAVRCDHGRRLGAAGGGGVAAGGSQPRHSRAAGAPRVCSALGNFLPVSCFLQLTNDSCHVMICCVLSPPPFVAGVGSPRSRWGNPRSMSTRDNYSRTCSPVKSVLPSCCAYCRSIACQKHGPVATASFSVRRRAFHGLTQADAAGPDDCRNDGMVTLHQMAEASFGQAGASATSVVYLGASRFGRVVTLGTEQTSGW